MEVEGAKTIFGRSIEKNGLLYAEYFGDGDSKGYMEVKNTDEGITVKKQECVGHVQKRVGNRLRGMKRKRKEDKMAEMKENEPNKKKTKKTKDPLDYLTYSVIDKLQNYYGIAVRANANDLEVMKKAIRGTLFHVSSSDDNHNHSQCPTGDTSWCKYNRDHATGESTHKHGPGLPVETRKLILPLYADLSSDELLQRCLHGKTQNQNESFNSMIWERLPKTKSAGLTQLELATYDALAHFNIGSKAAVLTFEKLDMIPGKYCVRGCLDINASRIRRSVYKGTAQARKRRKIIRGQSKKTLDKHASKEDVKYSSGVF